MCMRHRRGLLTVNRHRQAAAPLHANTYFVWKWVWKWRRMVVSRSFVRSYVCSLFRIYQYRRGRSRYQIDERVLLMNIDAIRASITIKFVYLCCSYRKSKENNIRLASLWAQNFEIKHLWPNNTIGNLRNFDNSYIFKNMLEIRKKGIFWLFSYRTYTVAGRKIDPQFQYMW